MLCVWEKKREGAAVYNCVLWTNCVCGGCVSGCQCEEGVHSRAVKHSVSHPASTHPNLLFPQWVVALQRLTQEVTQWLCRGWVLCVGDNIQHPTKARLASMDYEARNPKNNKDQNKTVLLVKFISNSNHLDDPSAHSSSGMICSGLGPVDTARESGCLRGEEVAKGRVCPLPKPHTGESMAAIISFPGSQWKRKEAALEPGSA